jgi:tripartite-type tricarboxylate transporter receptor subunit TctC
MFFRKWTSACAALVCACAFNVIAQQPGAVRALPADAKFPGKPVRVIVGFAPGGAVDIPARLIAQRTGEALGQPLVVENRPGADGILAGDFVVVWVSAGHAMNSLLHAKTIPYHPINDFAPVSLVASGPLTLVVNRALPVNGLQELVALARSKPGQLNFASSGSGGTMHLASC